jgi:hypothetical protein
MQGKVGGPIHLLPAMLGVILLAIHSPASAHTLTDLTELFEGEPVPDELVDLTHQLDATAGMNSFRAQAHDRQHQLLEDYLQARTARQCAEYWTRLPRLDQEITAKVESGAREEERSLREVRGRVELFLNSHCDQMR